VFFVINRTNKELTVSDLGLSLAPNQAIDLDKLYMRQEIGRSTDLASRIAEGKIQLKKKTDMVTYPLEENLVSREHIEDIKKEVGQQIRTEFAKMSLVVSPPSPSPFDPTKIMDAISNLTEIVQSRSSSPESSGQSTSPSENDDNISESQILRIHERTVQRIVPRDVKANITEEKKNVVKNDISKKVSELENLL